MVKRVLLAAAAAVLAVGFPLFGQSEAVVSRIVGKVEVQPPGAGWTPVKEGMKLPLGATISTGFGSEATLEVGASQVRVKALTRMRIDELAAAEGTQTTGLYLRVGRVRADVKTTEGLRHDFVIRSPVSTAAVRGTVVGFDTVNLDVTGGLARLSDQFGRGASVGDGEQGSAGGDEEPTGGEESKDADSTVNTRTGTSLPGGGSKVLSTGTIRIDWVNTGW